jgi:hypothetical protein
MFIAGGVLIGFVAILVLWIALKGRRIAGQHVFQASRWSRGNHLLPTQVSITPTSVTRYTPQWVGKLEESIHMAHISSVKIDTNLIFSDVLIETSGGHHPVKCHGHSKRDAVRMKALIEQYQTEYYKKA